MIITYLQVTGKPSCGREAIAMAMPLFWSKHYFKQCVIAAPLCNNESLIYYGRHFNHVP